MRGVAATASWLDRIERMGAGGRWRVASDLNWRRLKYWRRLLTRFGPNWRVLLSHLVLFGFVYPDKRENVPRWVMDELTRRLSVEGRNQQSDICYGTLLSREQYLHDIDCWKYRDARARPEGWMTEEQIRIWTDGIKN